MVFNSASDAELEFESISHEELNYYERIGFEESEIPGITGSVVMGNLNTEKHESTAMAFFATGNCVVAVGDFVGDASTGAQGSRGPVAAAKTLYKRIKRDCA